MDATHGLGGGGVYMGTILWQGWLGGWEEERDN